MKWFPHALSAALMLFAAGCGSGSQPATPPGTPDAPAPGGALVIAGIPKSTGGDFWETVKRGAQAAATELSVDLKWEGTVTETEIAEQNKIIDSMINLKVKGIALAPLNTKAQVKTAEAAVAAGIPLVIFDSDLDTDAYSAFVATNNKEGGAVGGRHLVELLKDKPGAKVMVMRYVQGTGSTEARADGFMAVAQAAGLTIVADPYPDNGTPEGCKNAAANTLETLVKDGKLDLDGIFACNLYATQGVASALEDLRKSGVQTQVRFVGFDTSKKLVEELQGGAIDALVSQNPERMGYLAVETLVKVIQGEPVEKQVDTGVVLVTRANLESDASVRKLVGLE